MNDNDGRLLLAAVGDMMLGEMPASFGFGVGSMIEKNGPLFPFLNCLEEFREADIVFGNLEAVLSTFDRDRSPFESAVFRGQARAAKGLCEAGFDVLSLANNHIMQHGRYPLEETIDILSKFGIGVVGLELVNKHVKNEYIIERKGLKIGFLAYNLRPPQYQMDHLLYVEGNFDIIHRDIQVLKEKANIVVVSLHWGDEFINHPSSSQIKLAHGIIDTGADIILGHHPHILQGIERYRSGIIAYSLGNFIFDMWQERFRKTMILKFRIEGPGEIDYDIIPVISNSHHQPVIVDGERGLALKNEINELSSQCTNPDLLRNYDTLLSHETRRYRREIYSYYFTHLHKYNPRRFVSNFAGAIKRRIV